MLKPKTDERRTLKAKPSMSVFEQDDSRKSPNARPKKTGKNTALVVTLVHKKKLLCSNTFNSEEHSTSDLLDWALQMFRGSLK